MWKVFLLWEVALVSAYTHSPCRLLHEVINDFRLDDYMGVWYPLLGWTNSPEVDVKGRCSKELITHHHGNITITEESLSDKNELHVASHHAWLEDPKEARITMWMFHAIKVPFWVVDTDYKNWAVVYSCLGDESDFFKTMLVLGRKRDFSKLWQIPEAKKNIRKSLRRSNLLRLRDLSSIDQSDCTN